MENKNVEGCLDHIPFASNLIFEIGFNADKSERVIKLRYNGVYMDLCKNGDSKQDYACSSKTFVRILNSKIVNDWKM